ncbi:MAG: helix-turn-helix domain-containing protein, partial [Planctomycetes bacterium]|nr:helix-turn-helix domain-containing protein [Planctomycetota bacterium]
YRYTSCRHPVEKPRWHALWLLARIDHPRTPAAVADVVGLSAVTVRYVLHRWNDHGPAGVADRRKDNGADPKLTARPRRPGRGEGPGRRGGQRRAAPGQAAADPGERSAPRPPAVHPGVAAGRAVLGARPGGRGERDLRPLGRTPAGGPPTVPLPGERPGHRQGSSRIPLGGPDGTINLQCKTV